MLERISLRTTTLQRRGGVIQGCLIALGVLLLLAIDRDGNIGARSARNPGETTEHDVRQHDLSSFCGRKELPPLDGLAFTAAYVRQSNRYARKHTGVVLAQAIRPGH